MNKVIWEIIMQKKTILFLAGMLILLILFTGCQKKSDETKLTSITLSEVAHSIFYAPQYAAIELGYFEEEGIDLILENAFGADKVMTALIRSEERRVGKEGGAWGGGGDVGSSVTREKVSER